MLMLVGLVFGFLANYSWGRKLLGGYNSCEVFSMLQGVPKVRLDFGFVISLGSGAYTEELLTFAFAT